MRKDRRLFVLPVLQVVLVIATAAAVVAAPITSYDADEMADMLMDEGFRDREAPPGFGDAKLSRSRLDVAEDAISVSIEFSISPSSRNSMTYFLFDSTEDAEWFFESHTILLESELFGERATRAELGPYEANLFYEPPLGRIQAESGSLVLVENVVVMGILIGVPPMYANDAVAYAYALCVSGIEHLERVLDVELVEED